MEEPELPLGTATATAPIDAEIQRLRNAITAAATRRDALAATLLSSAHVRGRPAPRRPPPGHHALADLIARHDAQTRLQTRRSLLTTTVFATRDADPAAASAVVHGLRIERFSRAQRRFLAPAYVFLRRDDDSNDDAARWALHRHTLPASVPVRALAARYLPAESDDGSAKGKGGGGGGPQDVEAFVRAVTDEVVGLLRRQEAIAALGARVGIKHVKTVDAEATDVRVVWTDGGVARVRAEKDGALRDVLVERRHARDQEAERRLRAAGTLEGLAEVL